jgi:uncharacterized protein YoxC
MYFTIIACTILALSVFAGMKKGIQKTFDVDQAENAYQSEEKIENQSERTSRLQEKNERLMDDVRAKMERMKRD